MDRRVGVRYHPYEPQRWTGGAYQLVSYLNQYGIETSLNSASQLIQRGADIRRFVERNARRDSEGRIVSSLQRAIGPNTPAAVRPGRAPVPDPAPMSIASMGGSAGVGTTYVNDITYNKTVVKGKRKRNVKKMLVNAFVKEAQDDSIFRFQSLTPFQNVESRSFKLAVGFNAGTGEERDRLFMPVFAFNLSALPSWTSPHDGQNRMTVPFYRLVKKLAASGPATQDFVNYQWEKVAKAGFSEFDGTKATADQDKYGWSVENSTGAMNQCNKYCHNWSDIQIGFQGNTTYANRVTYSIVSFLNGCGPERRYYKNRGGEIGWEETLYDDTALDSKDYSANDYFWDRFLQKKITHPMAANSTNAPVTRHLVFHSKKSILLPLETSIADDPKPPNRIVRIYYKNHDMYNLETSEDQEAEGYMLVNHNKEPGVNATTIPPGYTKGDTYLDQSADVYVPARSADKWLFIYAENVYNRDATKDITNTSSFDLNIRGKFTLFHQNQA